MDVSNKNFMTGWSLRKGDKITVTKSRWGIALGADRQECNTHSRIVACWSHHLEYRWSSTPKSGPCQLSQHRLTDKSELLQSPTLRLLQLRSSWESMRWFTGGNQKLYQAFKDLNKGGQTRSFMACPIFSLVANKNHQTSPAREDEQIIFNQKMRQPSGAI